MNVIGRLLLTGGIVTAFTIGLSGCNQQDASTNVLQSSKTANEKAVEMTEMDHMDDMMMEDDMMMDDHSTETTDASTTLEKAEYLAYSDSLRDTLLGKESHVLFFHAEWCPLCKGVEKNIKEDLANFPDGTKIVQVDFDTETELRIEYGIVVQSTLVVIDADGDVVERLSAPNNEILKASIEVSLT